VLDGLGGAEAPERPSGVRLSMGRLTEKETRLSEQRKYRSWTAQQ
jgi:hypothetical protein